MDLEDAVLTVSRCGNDFDIQMPFSIAVIPSRKRRLSSIRSNRILFILILLCYIIYYGAINPQQPRNVKLSSEPNNITYSAAKCKPRKLQKSFLTLSSVFHFTDLHRI